MNINNQDKIWDYFQNDMSDSFDGALPRLSFLCNKLEKGQKVLNIGVGNGSFEKLAQTSELDIHSLDPNEKSIDNLKKRLQISDTKAKVGYSQAIPFNDDVFDAVVMSEVLEHLSDEVIGKTLLEVKRVLKLNGKFLGTVPADEDLKTGTVVCPNCGDHFHRWGHMQSFSQESLFNMLSSEFDNINVRRVLLSDFRRLNWKGKILDILKKIQVCMNLKGSNQNLFFVAKK